MRFVHRYSNFETIIASCGRQAFVGSVFRATKGGTRCARVVVAFDAARGRVTYRRWRNLDKTTKECSLRTWRQWIDRTEAAIAVRTHRGAAK